MNEWRIYGFKIDVHGIVTEICMYHKKDVHWCNIDNSTAVPPWRRLTVYYLIVSLYIDPSGRGVQIQEIDYWD